MYLFFCFIRFIMICRVVSFLLVLWGLLRGFQLGCVFQMFVLWLGVQVGVKEYLIFSEWFFIRRVGGYVEAGGQRVGLLEIFQGRKVKYRQDLGRRRRSGRVFQIETVGVQGEEGKSGEKEICCQFRFFSLVLCDRFKIRIWLGFFLVQDLLV